MRHPTDAITQAANHIGKSHSGSWLGYHSLVYYAELAAPPAGAHFSVDSGLRDRVYSDTTGQWEEFPADEIEQAVHRLAGTPDLQPARDLSTKCVTAFSGFKAEILSILATEAAHQSDVYLDNIKNNIDKLEPVSKQDFIRTWKPTTPFLTSDMVAMGQGLHSPPHLRVLADVLVLKHSFGLLSELETLARKAGSHLSRKRRRARRAAELTGTNVFIGHGRSPLWRELKDFVNDRLGLPYDEFNRVPVAGVTNIARLSEMLNDAAIAFVLMTAEDETADGKIQARMNVIHEVGLFQGKLGFTKAIVLLEDGCEEFSNIQGLGQIRFPKGNIRSAFEEVRLVLEREAVISCPNS